MLFRSRVQHLRRAHLGGIKRIDAARSGSADQRQGMGRCSDIEAERLGLRVPVEKGRAGSVDFCVVLASAVVGAHGLKGGSIHPHHRRQDGAQTRLCQVRDGRSRESGVGRKRERVKRGMEPPEDVYGRKSSSKP